MKRLCGAGLFWVAIVAFNIAGYVTPLYGQASAIVNSGLPSGQAGRADPSSAAPASPSDELNSHLPSWLRFSGQLRFRGAGIFGDFFSPDSNDSYLLTRLRLNMRINATSWMSFHFQGQ